MTLNAALLVNDFVSSPVRAVPKSPEHHLMERILRELQAHPQSWAFQKPVAAEDVPDYYEFIKKPMGMYHPCMHSLQPYPPI
jgi:hypothetical protein